MNAVDYLIIAAVACAVGLAIVFLIRRRGCGECCGNCAECERKNKNSKKKLDLFYEK